MNNKVTVTQFVDGVKAIKRSTIISLAYRVDESGSRQKGGKKVLQKEVVLTAFLNHDYQKKVQKRTEDPTFQAEAMKGKSRLENSSTILVSEKTGAYMLYATVEQSCKIQTTYFHEGREISKEDAIKADLFSPSYFEPKPTKGRGTVSVEDDFYLISPYIERVLWATIEGVKYELV